MDVGGRFTGTVGGTMNMIGNLGGVVSSYAIGIIVGQTHNWSIAFYVIAAVYLLGAIFWLLVDPNTRLVVEDVELEPVAG